MRREYEIKRLTRKQKEALIFGAAQMDASVCSTAQEEDKQACSTAQEENENACSAAHAAERNMCSNAQEAGRDTYPLITQQREAEQKS